jgi:polyhydroxyalkanoate synthase subunit PhaC
MARFQSRQGLGFCPFAGAQPRNAHCDKVKTCHASLRATLESSLLMNEMNTVAAIVPTPVRLPISTVPLPDATLMPARDLDRWWHAQVAHLTGGLSIPALRMAFDDWLIHLAHNPAEQAELAQLSVQMMHKLALCVSIPQTFGLPVSDCVEPCIQDKRFAHQSWRSWPFNIISQSFLLNQAWWQSATTGVRGVSTHHEEVVSFTVRQVLDMVSPSNFIWTNPEVLALTASSGGVNLWKGLQNFADDAQRVQASESPAGVQAFAVGHDVAITPGQVIFRNHLIELIQYEPAGGKVRPEPVLIVPAWIMKYYILDLSPRNSLVKYLVDQGYTVFMVSWKNPGQRERDLGMDDYLRMGVMDAINAVTTVVPSQQVHAVGYCLGGTLMSIAAAAMGRDKDARLASLTMLAAQTDFTEPGELALFIDDSQVTFLEDIMWDQGYLDNEQMAGTFQLLNSKDLVWSRMLKDYLMGERMAMSDLMAWNADGTRLPYRMHSEYLRRLYLHNDLASGRYKVGDKAVALTDISCPIFCLGTVRDHVAPWRSVHKLQLLTDVEMTFALTSGGHNVGIVNPPGVPKRSYQMLTRAHDGPYFAPEAWLEAAPLHEGSWWPGWLAWLEERSGKPILPPSMGAPELGLSPLCAAPGTYVLQT